ncbi:hypothetical protein Leryth_002015 [Lithospermum erythrorhizon]|nr:hypothetical protein Leryth_002015 [Lithospermum erythrorhizon]
MNRSHYMDKQIMDLSNNDDFIDLNNPSEEEDYHRHVTTKKEDIKPMRPLPTTSPIRGRIVTLFVGSLVSQVDKNKWQKCHRNKSFHPMHSGSLRILRLSQMEGRTCQLENSMDELKIAIGNNYGSSDGEMRQLENLLREVQSDVHLIRDKQEIMEAQFQLAKLQVSKAEQQPEIHNSVKLENMQPATASAPQQLPPVTHSTAPPYFPPSNSAPPPPPQNLPQHVQVPNQFTPSQVPPIPQRDSYFPQPVQIPETASQQYQMPPSQQLQPGPPQQVPPQPQYQVPPQPQYSQPPPPPSQQPHPSLPALNLPPSQRPQGHHSEGTPYIQSQSYFLDSHHPPSHSPTRAPLSQHFSGAPPNMYEPQPNRLGPGVAGGYGSLSASGDPYSYSSAASQYGNGSPVKAPQHSAPPMAEPAGMGYPQLPTARLLPQALPTASPVGGESGSSGSRNRVPVDDVIDKVTTMGFSREQVKETVRRLTENGQSVDLNIVLDKLMNGGDGQPPRGWFGR